MRLLSQEEGPKPIRYNNRGRSDPTPPSNDLPTVLVFHQKLFKVKYDPSLSVSGHMGVLPSSHLLVLL